MLTREQILEVARVENAHRERIHRTLAQRSNGEREWREWEEATAAWHSQRYAIDPLWTNDFLQRLRTGDREAVEDAILFLETDPWFFRSGYLKERLIRGLKSAQLTTADITRLGQVILDVAQGPNRREFRNYCMLAVAIGGDHFTRQLERVSDEEDLEAKGKLRYLLRHLQRRRKTEPDSRPSSI